MLAKRLYEEGQGFAEAWNVGATGDGITVHQIAKRIVELWGKGELVVRPSPGWTEKTEGSSDEDGAARERLGLESGLTLEQSLEWTVEWYREYYNDPASAWRVTQEQLQRYMEMGD
jgi:CDP-glucose 4,6-dehydratase